jgi:hypothetical protein
MYPMSISDPIAVLEAYEIVTLWKGNERYDKDPEFVNEFRSNVMKSSLLMARRRAESAKHRQMLNQAVSERGRLAANKFLAFPKSLYGIRS